MELCTEEPFKEQPNPGFCSSFLVGEDMIATAGHCIPDEDMCAGVSFVFDFGYRTGASEEDPTLVPEANVYKCTSVVSVKYEGGRGSDYSIVKVDRPVMGRQPLKLNRDLALAVGDGVTVIGNPSGLPTKIASNANVRKVEGDQPYFIANLDTYGGNSGSAVFNTTTGMVEGILVRGETDFIPRGSCYVSNRCADDACRGEDVTKTSEFTEFVPVL
jgi:V8-like Glu-specific endopeptidase